MNILPPVIDTMPSGQLPGAAAAAATVEVGAAVAVVVVAGPGGSGGGGPPEKARNATKPPIARATTPKAIPTLAPVPEGEEPVAWVAWARAAPVATPVAARASTVPLPATSRPEPCAALRAAE